MGLLSRLKALLGFETERTEPTRRENVDVTIERTTEPAAETEAAVKGVEEESDVATEPEPDAEPESEPEPEPEPEMESEPEPEIERAEPETEEPEIEPEPDVEEPKPEPKSGESVADETTEPEPEIEEPVEPEERVALEDIKGIGPSYADRLSEAGVEHVAALADADAEELAERTGLSAKRIGRWIDRAQSR